MSRFRTHVFVCINERTPDDPRGHCKARGAEDILTRLKSEVHKRKLNLEIRVNKAGCLDQCAMGPSIVVYPEGVWYGNIVADDVDEIVETHLIGGQPVERLRTDRKS